MRRVLDRIRVGLIDGVGILLSALNAFKSPTPRSSQSKYTIFGRFLGGDGSSPRDGFSTEIRKNEIINDMTIADLMEWAQ